MERLCFRLVDLSTNILLFLTRRAIAHFIDEIAQLNSGKVHGGGQLDLECVKRVRGFVLPINLEGLETTGHVIENEKLHFRKIN